MIVGRAGRSVACIAAALALALALACLPATAKFAPGDRIAGRVVSVEDGDTLTVLAPGHTPGRIRVANVDAPESDQPHGDRSKRMLSASRRVFNGGAWLRRLSLAAWAIGGGMAAGAIAGLRRCLLGC